VTSLLQRPPIRRVRPFSWTDRLDSCLLPAVASLALLLASCGKPERRHEVPRPQTSLPSATIRPNLYPQPSHYPTVCTLPERRQTVADYLDAWQGRHETPETFRKNRKAFLELYADVYAQAMSSPPPGERELRLLFDMAGLAHTTAINPTAVKEALGCCDQSPPLGQQTSSSTPPGLPERVDRLLRAVPISASDSETFSSRIARQTRQVVLTDQLVDWSPACPLDVCGTSEPVSRTIVLTSASYAEQTPKPDWSMAAVAVHEAAHVAWFHSEAVAGDPRLLLSLANEREAWRQTAVFLRGLLRSPDRQLQPYVRVHGAAIRAMLKQARQAIRDANSALGRSPGDESLVEALPEGISEAALRGTLR
jgi:hypothetical protein